MRNGPNPRLQLKALAEASLEVLRAAEALEAASDHDADTLAEGFTLLHAAKTEKKIDTVRHQKNDWKNKTGWGTENSLEQNKTKPFRNQNRLGNRKQIRKPDPIQEPRSVHNQIGKPKPIEKPNTNANTETGYENDNR